MAKKRQLKKYANGTGNTGMTIQNYLQTPQDALAKNSILQAKAELDAQTNPWAIGIEVGSQLLSQLASSGKLVNAGGLADKYGTVETGFSKAANGDNDIDGDVEVEGGELLETPQGQVAEVQGPRHENGGVPLEVNKDVPEGTKVYSDRLKVGDKTLAERKAIREKRLEKLDKLLTSNKSDRAIRNTITRRKAAIENEEQQDLYMQESVQVLSDQVQKLAGGTGSRGIITPVGEGLYARGSDYLNPIQPKVEGVLGDLEFQVSEGLIGDPNKIDTTNSKFQREARPTLTPMGGNLVARGRDDNKIVAPLAYLDTPDSTSASAASGASGTSKDGYVPTVGDFLGIAGDIYSGFAPMKNTLENRAGDLGNVNVFKDYGRKALETLGKQEEALAASKAASIDKVNSTMRGYKRMGRNSARGINQMRAMDTAANIAANKGSIDTESAFATQLMQILGLKAQTQLGVDQGRMSGEAAKNLADIQDRDNFYTQLGKDKVGKGKAIQTAGKDINEMLKNPVMLELLSQFGKYVKVNNKGELTGK